MLDATANHMNEKLRIITCSNDDLQALPLEMREGAAHPLERARCRSVRRTCENDVTPGVAKTWWEFAINKIPVHGCRSADSLQRIHNSTCNIQTLNGKPSLGL